MIGLFFIGMTLTVVGFYMAYRIGGRNELKKFKD